MADNIALTRTGADMIASYREMPWHRKGKVFMDKVSGRELLVAAGLDFKVMTCPLFANVKVEGPAEDEVVVDAAGNIQTVSVRKLNRDMQVTYQDKIGLYRSDTGVILGDASERYEVFQNEEMIDVIDSIAKDGNVVYEVAGGLGRGERVWVLAHIPDLSFDVKGDKMRQYLTIFSSHNGTSALQIFPTTVRVVCANTWRMATAEKVAMQDKHGRNNVKTGYSIKHTKNMKEMVDRVVAAFAEVVETNKFSREFYTALAETPATPTMKSDFFNFVANGGSDSDSELAPKAKTRRENKVEGLNALLASPTNQTPATKGTAWGLFNAATEWIDHEAPTKKTKGRDEYTARFEMAQFGSGVDLKDAAMTKIVELALT